jgi:hypothetical protein
MVPMLRRGRSISAVKDCSHRSKAVRYSIASLMQVSRIVGTEMSIRLAEIRRDRATQRAA